MSDRKTARVEAWYRGKLMGYYTVSDANKYTEARLIEAGEDGIREEFFRPIDDNRFVKGWNSSESNSEAVVRDFCGDIEYEMDSIIREVEIKVVFQGEEE